MFETHTNAKVVIPEELEEQEEQAWWYVKLSMHIPWFYVTCDFKYGKHEVLTQMLLITQVEHLIEVSQSRALTIKCVDLVIPERMNGGKGWKMGALSEIWVGREPGIDHYQEAYVFVLDDGNDYVYSALDTDKRNLIGLVKIYPYELGYF